MQLHKKSVKPTVVRFTIEVFELTRQLKRATRPHTVCIYTPQKAYL